MGFLGDVIAKSGNSKTQITAIIMSSCCSLKVPFIVLSNKVTVSYIATN